MTITRQKREPLIACLVIYLSLCLCWSAWQLYVFPQTTSWDGSLWLNTFIKCLLWVSPFLLALLSKKDGWLETPGRMFCTSFPFAPLFAMLCGTVCFLYTVRIANGLQNVIVFWDWHFLLFSVCAGVVEEIFFRGFFFNRTAVSLGVARAAVLNGALFALYHYPELFMRLELSGILTLRFLMLFLVGVIFCLAFAKWRNLWLTIVVHTLWNFISYLWALAG